MIGKVLRRVLVEEERQRQLAEPLPELSMVASTEAAASVGNDTATASQEVAQ
jgi:hypothetical protein